MVRFVPNPLPTGTRFEPFGTVWNAFGSLWFDPSASPLTPTHRQRYIRLTLRLLPRETRTLNAERREASA
jgi:hypothetical protein